MFAFFTSSISRRLYTLLAIFTLGFAGVVTFQLSDLRSNLDSFKRTELQSVVQGATSIAQNYYDRFQAGEFTEEEAKHLALESLRGFRYQGKEYVFIDSFDMVMVMHPFKPEKVGSDRSIEKDSTGKLFIKEMITDAMANGSAFQTYMFVKPEGGEGEKLSYAQAFKPWGWTIASGVLTTQVVDIFMQAAVISGAITVGITLLMLALGVMIARSIAKPMSRLTKNMREVANGNFDVTLAGQARKDEIGDMTRAVEVFRENGMKVAAMTEAEAANIIRAQAERTKMMAELQVAFGQVVDAAIAGDFSQRVNASFPDAELNTLAGSVNNLVDTVDRGLGETGDVLAALADTNLTLRVRGQLRRRLRQAQGRHQCGGRQADRHRRAAARHLADAQDRHRGNPLRRQRPLRTHHQAGGDDRGDQRRDGAAGGDGDGQCQKGRRRLGQGRGGVALRPGWRRGDGAGHRGDGADHHLLVQDLQHHRHDRRHRLPDQPAGAQRLGGSGAGRRGRQGLCRGGHRGAAPGADRGAGLLGGQGADRAERQRGRRAAPSWWPMPPASWHSMLEAVKENNMLLEGIARASREQASSIEEVNTAVRTMDEMTQHNAALVEEINAAIEQTETQASELDRVVDDLHPRRRRPAGAGPGRGQAHAQAGAQADRHQGAAAAGQDRRQILSQPGQCRHRPGLVRVLSRPSPTTIDPQ